ncbi:MAG: peptidoglycan-binding domain-containing protein [Candidatus Nomurabacteria bacterium]
MKKIISILGFFGILASSAVFASAAYFDQTPVAQCNTQITNNLQSGSQNDDVYALQSMLSRGGYMYVQPNGYFGPSTKAALKRFQIDNAIYPTGYVGPATRNAVNERLCDNDVRGEYNSYDSYGYSSYSYSSGVTYVDQFDKYVAVVSPNITNPSIYNNPPTTTNVVYNVAQTAYNNSVNIPANVLIPATTQNQIQSTNIIYTPYTGYTYGIVPQSGVLTITTPLTNSLYNEGDTVNLAWTTSNLNAHQYQILLENNSGRISKVVALTSTNAASFILTKEILDFVCSGTCDNSNTGSFSLVITTPITDIAGVTSTFRAAVSPITIKRPYYGNARVSITGSKSPVNSTEVFKLYVNVPNVNTYNNNYPQYTFKIRAICVNSVEVSIAGVPCGQDFIMPVYTNNSQQEIPAKITNATFYRQDVIFEITAINSVGALVGSARTTVTVNPAPYNW